MQEENAGTARTNEAILRTFPGQVIRITVMTTPVQSSEPPLGGKTPVQSSEPPLSAMCFDMQTLVVNTMFKQGCFARTVAVMRGVNTALREKMDQKVLKLLAAEFNYGLPGTSPTRLCDGGMRVCMEMCEDWSPATAARKAATGWLTVLLVVKQRQVGYACNWLLHDMFIKCFGRWRGKHLQQQHVFTEIAEKMREDQTLDFDPMPAWCEETAAVLSKPCRQQQETALWMLVKGL